MGGFNESLKEGCEEVETPDRRFVEVIEFRFKGTVVKRV